MEIVMILERVDTIGHVIFHRTIQSVLGVLQVPKMVGVKIAGPTDGLDCLSAQS